MTSRRSFEISHGPLTQQHKQVLSWMFALWRDGENTCTRLAEEAADEFDLYEEDGDIPEWMFDLALIVEEEYVEPAPPEQEG